jgi:hypothetical protein
MPAVAVLLLLPELTVSVQRRRRAPARPGLGLAASHFASALVQTTLLVLLGAHGWWSPSVRGPPEQSFIFGAAVAWLAMRTWNRLQRPAEHPADLRAYLRQWSAALPRGRGAAALQVARTVCTSTTEEIARSLFVLGPDGEPRLPGVLFAVGFNLVLHLYQGRRAITFHLAFSALAIGALLTLGLPGAVGLHVAFNLLREREGKRLVSYVRQVRALRQPFAAR